MSDGVLLGLDAWITREADPGSGDVTPLTCRDCAFTTRWFIEAKRHCQTTGHQTTFRGRPWPAAKE